METDRAGWRSPIRRPNPWCSGHPLQIIASQVFIASRAPFPTTSCSVSPTGAPAILNHASAIAISPRSGAGAKHHHSDFLVLQKGQNEVAVKPWCSDTARLPLFFAVSSSPAPLLCGSPTPPCSTAAPLHRHLVSSAAFPTRARGIRVCRRLEKTTAYNPPAAVCSAWDNGTAASPREATGRPSASRVGAYLQMCSIPTGLYRRVVHALRACTTHRRRSVYRISNVAYRLIYRLLIQPTDRDVVSKLVNALHVSQDQLPIHMCTPLCGYLIEYYLT
jgi:hypothetical protein